MIVLDASVVVALVLGLDGAEAVLQRIADPRVTLHAPHLLDVEVAQVVRRYAAGREVTTRRAAEALDDLAGLDIERYGHTPLLGQVWALRRNLTAYDAVYVALAMAIDAPLLTFDDRIARAPGLRVTVERP